MMGWVLILMGISLAIFLYVYVVKRKSYGGVVVRIYSKKLSFHDDTFLTTYHIVVLVRQYEDGSKENGIVKKNIEIAKEEFDQLDLVYSVLINSHSNKMVYFEPPRSVEINNTFEYFLDKWGNKYTKNDEEVLRYFGKDDQL